MLKEKILQKIGKTLVGVTLSPFVILGGSIGLIFVLGMDLQSAKKKRKEIKKELNDLNKRARLINNLKLHKSLDSAKKEDYDLAMCTIVNDDFKTYHENLANLSI